MLNLNSIMIGTEKPEELAAFYEKILGKKPDMVEGQWFGFAVGSCFLSIGFHDKVKGKAVNPERIILNFETTEVKEEFARMKAAGATVILEPYQMGPEGNQAWIATLADPDGNYFQLMTPWEAGK
jgi:predicted enzyme related to lactoylglutathione lyase